MAEDITVKFPSGMDRLTNITRATKILAADDTGNPVFIDVGDVQDNAASQIVGHLTATTQTLPTTRDDGTPLQNNDRYTVSVPASTTAVYTDAHGTQITVSGSSGTMQYNLATTSWSYVEDQNKTPLVADKADAPTQKNIAGIDASALPEILTNDQIDQANGVASYATVKQIIGNTIKGGWIDTTRWGEVNATGTGGFYGVKIAANTKVGAIYFYANAVGNYQFLFISSTGALVQTLTYAATSVGLNIATFNAVTSYSDFYLAADIANCVSDGIKYKQYSPADTTLPVTWHFTLSGTTYTPGSFGNTFLFQFYYTSAADLLRSSDLTPVNTAIAGNTAAIATVNTKLQGTSYTVTPDYIVNTTAGKSYITFNIPIGMKKGFGYCFELVDTNLTPNTENSFHLTLRSFKADGTYKTFTTYSGGIGMSEGYACTDEANEGVRMTVALENFPSATDATGYGTLRFSVIDLSKPITPDTGLNLLKLDCLRDLDAVIQLGTKDYNCALSEPTRKRIVGLDPILTKVYNKLSSYDVNPIFFTAGLLANLTVECINASSTTHSAYCIHMDNDTMQGQKITVRNVLLNNVGAHCAGIGTRRGVEIIFDRVDFSTKNLMTDAGATLLANCIYLHNTTVSAASDPTMPAILRLWNCNGIADDLVLKLQDYSGNSDYVQWEFIGNTFLSNNYPGDAAVQLQYYGYGTPSPEISTVFKNKFSLLPTSRGNNISFLNAQ